MKSFNIINVRWHVFYKCLIGIVFVLLGSNLQAQFYSTGSDPSSAKWEQINTENFQIIFQRSFNQQAQKIAGVLEHYYGKVGNTLNNKPKKISIIVHNQTMFSNGYVAWAPKRMELYTTPPQDIYLDPWLKHLCIHELRHVVQIDKLNQGITKILAIVFGQQAIGLVAGQLPMWYYEGDAVCTETAFTRFGRGRLPFFSRGIKAHLLSNEKVYSFDKMLLGSYKDYVPNHYELGYQLTAFARYKYGAGVWSEIENHVARNSYTLLPTSFAFYRGLKKNTGLSQKGLYQQTIKSIDSTWSAEESTKKIIEPKYIQKYKIDGFENYLNPVCIDDESTLALKKGLSHIPQFVIVKESSEQIICEPGYLISDDYSYSNNLLVWAEYKPDARWQNREFTSLKTYNLNTQKLQTLIKKSRYYSPAINNRADQIALIEVDKENSTFLVLLSKDGKLIKKITPNQGNFIQRPKWSQDDEKIYVIELTNEGKQISRYSLKGEFWEELFKIENADIQRIVPSKGQVYFHSTVDGTDNIYVYDEKTQEVNQISSSRFGNSDFDLKANSSEIITNEYTSQGFRLAKIPVERASWKNAETISYSHKFANILAGQEAVELNEIPDSQFITTPYRKPLNIFNFHSWIPAFIDHSNIELQDIFTNPSLVSSNIYPGIMLLSQNKLSTVESILSYGYKNGDHYISSSMIFRGQYPVIKLSAYYGEEQGVKATSNVDWFPQPKAGYSYDVDIYIPLNFTRGSYIRGIRPLISVEYFDNYYYNYTNDYYIKGLEYVQTGLFLYSYKIKSKRDIIPKLGAILDFNLRNTPFDSELFGYVFSADAIAYLPGGKNKGIKLDIGYQYQKPKLYLMGGMFNFPRGIANSRTEKLAKVYSDYVFPIAYPDWNLGSFLYVKRIRGDVFFDYAINSYRIAGQTPGSILWNTENYNSFGIELTADYHLLRTIFPLNSGIRLGYSPTEKTMIFGFLFGIDLNSL